MINCFHHFITSLSFHLSDFQLLKAGFVAPSPIQAQSWPIVMQNKDVVAVAKTGSGKTLGYLVPGFLHLQMHKNNARMGPTVLVLAPTRELATQIEDECVKFSKSSKISSTVRFSVLVMFCSINEGMFVVCKLNVCSTI